MSETGTFPLAADAIEAQAADLLQRRNFWNWSDADQAELDSWLAQSPAHLVAYLRLESALDRTDRLVALRAPSAEMPSPVARSWSWPMLLKIAAAFAFVAVLGIAAASLLIPRPGERIYRTAIGGRETITFTDGSKIELNTNSVLRARMTTNERVVWLDRGEAFFQVKHDAAHPFVVMVGERRVTDLGTQFIVRREPKSLEVAVMQGRVWFDTPDKQTLTQTALLMPGDVATVAANKMSRTKMTVHELSNELAWRRGVLVFHHTPLSEAAEELNRYNRLKIVISDSAAAGLTMNGSFPANSISAFTEAARDVFGLKVEYRGDEIVITR
jgi:transmembrane sensor